MCGIFYVHIDLHFYLFFLTTYMQTTRTHEIRLYLFSPFHSPIFLFFLLNFLLSFFSLFISSFLFFFLFIYICTCFLISYLLFLLPLLFFTFILSPLHHSCLIYISLFIFWYHWYHQYYHTNFCFFICDFIL